jgi:DNA-binding MarR family transcriptional regulator
MIMVQPASNLSESAFHAFLRASGLLRGKLDSYFARFGVSAAQWGVLRALQRAEAGGRVGLCLKDLGQCLLVRPPSVTSLIDRLERTGWVTRKTASGDRRAKLVQLTAAGRRLLTQVLEHHPEQICALMGGLSQAEQGEFQQMLERMAVHLEALGTPGCDAPETLNQLNSPPRSSERFTR